MSEMNKETYNIVQSYIKTQKTFHISDVDMENIIHSVYGKNIEMLESQNDITHEYNVVDQMNEYDDEKLEKALKDGHLEYYNYGVILNDLCEKEYIQPGKYFIRVSW